MSVEPNIHLPIIGLSDLSEQKLLLSKDNPQKVCLVYHSEHDTNECHAFLEKVFKAIKLDFEMQVSKVILMNANGFSLSNSAIFEQHEIWICLGIAPKYLGLNIETVKYGPISFLGNKLLWTDDPLEILEDPNLKKQLWVSLQKLFPTQ